MTTKLEEHLEVLKTEIDQWPQEQKGSFVGGLGIGLMFAAVIAKEAGCDIIRNETFDAFRRFLDSNEAPVRKRTSGKGILPKDWLARDVKELLRHAIAAHLRIPKDKYDTSLECVEEIDRYLIILTAIGNRTKLDDAINDVQVFRSLTGTGALEWDRIKEEVEACYEQFPTQIAAIECFNDLRKRPVMEAKAIWGALRSHLTLDFGYEDDELCDIDARYS